MSNWEHTFGKTAGGKPLPKARRYRNRTEMAMCRKFDQARRLEAARQRE